MKGKILIASPSLLTDLVFFKSIILIVEKTNEGITGFIINRRLDKLLMKEVETKKKLKLIYIMVVLYHQKIFLY